jgi:hypothetical protein
MTLTGLGERSHLARREVDLDTHIEDVVNLLKCEDLRDAVLVGHSYDLATGHWSMLSAPQPWPRS